ncbi:dnaJ homolog subfamily C member 11-like [Liolophura sinensis]|uniref:dnaJ homolog subfamily C member 11-like n=1 Tax=Liolophura sinensis TaxID=3198878 RepID=UPI003158C7F3
MAAPMLEDEDQFADDYYSLLNLSKDASPDDVNVAFRRLSKMFHPDKHVNPVQKKQAEIMFNKVKRAHEVLSDKHRRMVYDMYGEKGLETDGLEVVSRVKSPAEIIAEYERLQREREERRLQQRTNPRGTVSVGINATDLFESYEDVEYSPGLPSVEISNMTIFQSVEAPLTVKDTAILAGTLSTQNGNGTGSFIASWRRLTSDKGWAEVEASAGSGFGLSLKGFRQLGRRCYGTVSCSLHSVSRGFRPGFSTMVAYQIDKNLQGRLSWNPLHPSAMNTTIVYDTEKHHAVLTLQLGIPTTFISTSYSRKFPEEESKLRISCKAGTFGALLEYGFEKKITQYSVLGATMVIGVPTGVLLKIKLHRGSQTFLFPVQLAETVVPSAVFYGTIVPMAVYQVAKVLIINPFLQQQKEKELEKKREEHSDRLRQRQQEAEAAISLMKETVERSLEIEERKAGLIILKATYGKLTTDEDTEDRKGEDCIDVTIPLQALVKDSKLLLPENTTKSGLPGFYDPYLGEEKSLFIRYRFRNKAHQVTLGDRDPIRLPQQKHLLKDTESDRMES